MKRLMCHNTEKPGSRIQTCKCAKFQSIFPLNYMFKYFLNYSHFTNVYAAFIDFRQNYYIFLCDVSRMLPL